MSSLKVFEVVIMRGLTGFQILSLFFPEQGYIQELILYLGAVVLEKANVER